MRNEVFEKAQRYVIEQAELSRAIDRLWQDYFEAVRAVKQFEADLTLSMPSYVVVDGEEVKLSNNDLRSAWQESVKSTNGEYLELTKQMHELKSQINWLEADRTAKEQYINLAISYLKV